MFGRRKLKDEIIKLNYRVAELEERLCPCESHDWKLIGTKWTCDSFGSSDSVYTYKCKTCGKTKDTRYPLNQ